VTIRNVSDLLSRGSGEGRLELPTHSGKAKGAGSELSTLGLLEQRRQMLDREQARSLAELHPLISDNRDVENMHYMVGRHYSGSDDAELCAIKLRCGEQLRRGGGARRKNANKDAMDDVTLAKSNQRARSNVRRKCLSACVDRLLTLTFRENVTDVDEAWSCFEYFCKLMRHQFPNRWQYVAVPEYQERGAVHFHVAIKGFFNVNLVRKLWLRAAGKREGNIDITSPRRAGKNSWNPRRVGNYIAKYISKDADTAEFNRRRFSTGGKIELPPVMRGWLVLGVPVISVMTDVIGAMTHRPVRSVFESDDYRSVTYLST